MKTFPQCGPMASYCIVYIFPKSSPHCWSNHVPKLYPLMIYKPWWNVQKEPFVLTIPGTKWLQPSLSGKFLCPQNEILQLFGNIKSELGGSSIGIPTHVAAEDIP